MSQQQLPPGAFPYRYQRMCKKRLNRRREGTVAPEIMVAVKAFMDEMTSILPKDKTFIDIGAGTGNLVDDLVNEGYDIFGVDGTPNIERLTDGLVIWTDLTKPYRWLHGVAQWGICLEVGEHIPPEFETAFLDQLCLIPTEALVMTWATPGTPGRGHVNCQNNDYVVERFAERGWMFDESESRRVRIETPGRRGLRNLFLFRKEN